MCLATPGPGTYNMPSDFGEIEKRLNSQCMMERTNFTERRATFSTMTSARRGRETLEPQTPEKMQGSPKTP